MSIMFHQLVIVSLLLCFLTASASGQQQLKGGQIVCAKHVGAIAMNPESATSNFRTIVEGSESVSSIVFQEGVNGYRCALPNAEYSFNSSNCSRISCQSIQLSVDQLWYLHNS
jgi:hypothetical protein